MMFSWLSLLGAGLWALMYYSAPESNLQPYENIKEAKVKPKTNETLESTNFTLPSDLETGKMIKTAQEPVKACKVTG